ncbi:MAG: polyphosphate:AMP phosphotransferase [Armatimonadota bacterium]|nr:polyphosphate:AMP phosphotransferase [Armatimonadota bacterium]
MFEAAELGNKISKEVYEREAPALREELLRLQGELAEADFPVIIVTAGMRGAGRGETVNLLLEWMDARGINTHAFHDPSDEERERPRFWRYWMALPPKKRIGILFGSWYTDPLYDRVFKRIHAAKFDQELARIEDFERMLVNEGALVLKFWLHLSKGREKARLKSLEEDPLNSWRVTKQDWKLYQLYDRVHDVAEHALRRTSTAEAPWHIVEGFDARYRSLSVARIMARSLKERLCRTEQKAASVPVALPHPDAVNVINQLDYTLKLDKPEYEKELARYQGRLNRLVRGLHEKHRSIILVFEGPDAGGKGGAIRRLTAAMDARDYRVISISAPTEEERAQPYLWRFWRHLPRLGRVTIYDRSWYGRLLVERLEGFCAPQDWQRAYGEINMFEEQLAEAGIVVVKFWLAVTPDEQLRRFQARSELSYKQFKITEEDWRNREKWGAYEAAACQMIERTSTEIAPWTLVEGNDKRWARIKVLKTTCERLERVLRDGKK